MILVFARFILLAQKGFTGSLHFDVSWVSLINEIVKISNKQAKNFDISTNLSILQRYGFYIVILNKILYNGNDNSSKISEIKNTSTHGSSSLLFNFKVLAIS